MRDKTIPCKYLPAPAVWVGISGIVWRLCLKGAGKPGLGAVNTNRSFYVYKDWQKNGNPTGRLVGREFKDTDMTIEEIRDWVELQVLCG